MTRILICRHGETYHNKLIYKDEQPQLDDMPTPIMFSEEDTMLTLKGEEQAAKLGDFLVNKISDKEVVLMSSPWYRAARTKEIVSEKLRDSGIRVTDIGEDGSITDVDLGGLDPINVRGKPDLEDEFYSYWKARFTDRAETRPRAEGGESINDVKTRAREWLTSIESNQKDKAIIVITHAGFIYALLAEIFNLSSEKTNLLMDNLDLENGKSIEMDIVDGVVSFEQSIVQEISNALGAETRLDTVELKLHNKPK